MRFRAILGGARERPRMVEITKKQRREEVERTESREVRTAKGEGWKERAADSCVFD